MNVIIREIKIDTNNNNKWYAVSFVSFVLPFFLCQWMKCKVNADPTEKKRRKKLSRNEQQQDTNKMKHC